MDTGQRIYRFCCYDLSSVGCGDQISDTHWLWSARPEQCGQLLSWVRLQQHSGGGGGAGDPSTIYTTSIPQLVSSSCLAATMGQSVMTLSRLCPCPHTTYNTTPRSPVSGGPGSGPGRAAQPILQLRAPPRPAPAPARHQTRPFVFIVRPGPAPARPRRRAGPALRTRTTPHILQSAGWPPCSHRRAPAGPSSPPAPGAAAGGVAGAGPCWRQPSRHLATAALGRAGRGRHWPHTTTAQQQRRGKILAKTQSAQLLHT